MILVFSVCLAIFAFVLLVFKKPQNVGIFEVGNPSQQSINTTITGSIIKDTAVGVEGNYFLVMKNQAPILLDLQGEVDFIVGRTIKAEGLLIPKTTSGQPKTFKVITFTLE